MFRVKGAFIDCKIVTDGNDLRCKRLAHLAADELMPLLHYMGC